MLGDTAEKSKNPLKKAMRRRNAKTVTFNPPTYYEANEPDWSDIEAENENTMGNGPIASRRNGGAQVDRGAISTTDGTNNAQRGADGLDDQSGISGPGEQCENIYYQAGSDLSRRCSNTRQASRAAAHRFILERRQNAVDQDHTNTRSVKRRSQWPIK